jgi:hypothetical protein
MPTFLIERELPGVGLFTADDLKGISQKSNCVLQNLGPEIQWLHSYVTDDKIYCVYQSRDEDLIREHANQGGFPVDSIAQVGSTISPATGGRPDL